MNFEQPEPVDVVIAILLRADGRFLLNTRPEGKPHAGSWELPGGKLAPGESVAAGIRRELREELGIDIGAAEHARRLLPVVEYSYPRVLIRLHPCIFGHWHGEPRPMEGQRFFWQSIWDDETHVAPVLPATVPVIETLRGIRETIHESRPDIVFPIDD